MECNEVCQNLIESMHRRIEAVFKAKGGHTKYYIVKQINNRCSKNYPNKSPFCLFNDFMSFDQNHMIKNVYWRYCVRHC